MSARREGWGWLEWDYWPVGAAGRGGERARPGRAPAALAGHADHYLEKPLRVDQLIATATALIGRGRQRWAGPYPDTPGHDTLPT